MERSNLPDKYENSYSWRDVTRMEEDIELPETDYSEKDTSSESGYWEASNRWEGERFYDDYRNEKSHPPRYERYHTQEYTNRGYDYRHQRSYQQQPGHRESWRDDNHAQINDSEQMRTARYDAYGSNTRKVVPNDWQSTDPPHSRSLWRPTNISTFKSSDQTDQGWHSTEPHGKVVPCSVRSSVSTSTTTSTPPPTYLDDEESIAPPVPEKKYLNDNGEVDTADTCCVKRKWWILGGCLLVLLLLCLLGALLWLFALKVHEFGLNGQMRLHDEEFQPDYSNPSTPKFENFSGRFCDAMDLTIEGIDVSSNYGGCAVTSLQEGSVIVNYSLVFVTTRPNTQEKQFVSTTVDEVNNGINASLEKASAPLNEEFGKVEITIPVTPGPPITPPPMRTTTTTPTTTPSTTPIVLTIPTTKVDITTNDMGLPTVTLPGKSTRISDKTSTSTSEPFIPTEPAAPTDDTHSTYPDSSEQQPSTSTGDSGIMSTVMLSQKPGSTTEETQQPSSPPKLTHYYSTEPSSVRKSTTQESYFTESPETSTVTEFEDDLTSKATRERDSTTVGESVTEQPQSSTGSLTETSNSPTSTRGVSSSYYQVTRDQASTTGMDPTIGNEATTHSALVTITDITTSKYLSTDGDAVTSPNDETSGSLTESPPGPSTAESQSTISLSSIPMTEEQSSVAASSTDGMTSHSTESEAVFTSPLQSTAPQSTAETTPTGLSGLSTDDTTTNYVSSFMSTSVQPKLSDTTPSDIVVFRTTENGQTTHFVTTKNTTPEDICADSPCENNGTCIEDEYSPVGFRCECSELFTGDTCEEEVNPCMPNPCFNNAICIVEGLHNFTCVCFPCDCSNDRFQPLCEGGDKPCAVLEEGWYPWPHDCAYIMRCVLGDESSVLPCADGWVSSATGQCVPLTHDDACTTNIVYFCEDDGIKCFNGGTCVNSEEGFECLCPAAFTGRHCETEMEDCALDTCDNGGYCEDTDDGFTCNCTEGFTGRRCQSVVVPCATNPCQNGGTCVQDGEFTYHCVCAECECANKDAGEYCVKDLTSCAWRPTADRRYPVPGNCSQHLRCSNGVDFGIENCPAGQVFNPDYTGAVFCADTNDVECAWYHDLRDCSDVECENNGTCVDTPGGFECECNEYYYGEFCENDIEPCSEDLCENGGTCDDSTGTAICMCPDVYTGRRCETEITPCDPDPCMNNGTCVPKGIDFVCYCGYTCECANEALMFCEIDLTNCAGSPASGTFSYPHPDECDRIIECHNGIFWQDRMCPANLVPSLDPTEDCTPDIPPCHPLYVTPLL